MYHVSKTLFWWWLIEIDTENWKQVLKLNINLYSIHSWWPKLVHVCSVGILMLLTNGWAWSQVTETYLCFYPAFVNLQMVVCKLLPLPFNAFVVLGIESRTSSTLGKCPGPCFYSHCIWTKKAIYSILLMLSPFSLFSRNQISFALFFK